jgi:hypothetical protein
VAGTRSDTGGEERASLSNLTVCTAFAWLVVERCARFSPGDVKDEEGNDDGGEGCWGALVCSLDGEDDGIAREVVGEERDDGELRRLWWAWLRWDSARGWKSDRGVKGA